MIKRLCPQINISTYRFRVTPKRKPVNVCVLNAKTLQKKKQAKKNIQICCFFYSTNMQCFGCIQISDIWMSFDYTELNFVFHRYETFFTIMEDLGSMPLASLLVHSISTTCCWMNYYQGSVIPSTSTKLSRIKSKTQVNSLLVSIYPCQVYFFVTEQS